MGLLLRAYSNVPTLFSTYVAQASIVEYLFNVLHLSLVPRNRTSSNKEPFYVDHIRISIIYGLIHMNLCLFFVQVNESYYKYLRPLMLENKAKL